MADRFEDEFYKSPWHHVLPVGPYGIQPYVRNSHTSRLVAVPPPQRRIIATLGGAAQAVSAFLRLAALAMAKQAASPDARPRRARPSLRLAQKDARPVEREREAPRSLSKAA